MPRKEDEKIAKKHEVPICPVGPRFIAIHADRDDVTEGGIVLPQKAQDKEQAVQPEVIIIRLSDSLSDKGVQPGSRVLLNPAARHQGFSYMGEEYLMVDWASVKGIYEA